MRSDDKGASSIQLHWRAVCRTASLLEATCRRALNFLLALSSNRRDAQNGQIKSGLGSFDVSKSKNGCRSSATPCSQPPSPGPQAQGTAPALHDGCKFSACDFGYRADAGVRPTGGAFAPAGLEKSREQLPVRISDFLEAARRDRWERGIYSAAAVHCQRSGGMNSALPKNLICAPTPCLFASIHQRLFMGRYGSTCCRSYPP